MIGYLVDLGPSATSPKRLGRTIRWPGEAVEHVWERDPETGDLGWRSYAVAHDGGDCWEGPE